MTARTSKARPSVRITFFVCVVLLWLLALSPFGYVAAYISATIYADNIIEQYGQDYVGTDIDLFKEVHGQPNWVRREQPRIIESDTGRVKKTFAAYEVLYYCPWPSFIHAGPGLKVFVNTSNQITRLKGPLD